MKKKHTVATVSFGKKPLAKIAKELQKVFEEFEKADAEINAVLTVPGRGLVVVSHKMESSPLDMLKALLGGGLPPGVSMEVVGGADGSAAEGPIAAILSKLQGRREPTGKEMMPSDDAMRLLGPIKTVLDQVPKTDEAKVLPQIFEQVTNGMPVEKMRAVATELDLLKVDHGKHCTEKDCVVHSMYERVGKLLTEKARLNTM